MNTSLSLDFWLRGLAEDPGIFPHQLDVVNRRLLLVRLAPERVRTAAFLDRRVLTGEETGAWVPLAAALEAAPHNTGPTGIILHCGHCGSTLVSRLLGELPGAWVLREPLILQTLAAEARAAGTPRARLTPGEYAGVLRLSQAAYGRLPAGASRAIVKHTSLTANLGAELMRGATPPAVLCLSIPLADYLATMLRDPGLREGVRLAAGEWIQDLAAMPGGDCPALADLADAELAALNWTAAQLAFARTGEIRSERILNWNFGDFLADPETRLGALAAHFGLPIAAADSSRALSTQWMQRYAKDPRQSFNASLRKQELDQARQQFADEIGTGLRFAEHLARQLPFPPLPARPEGRS